MTDWAVSSLLEMTGLLMCNYTLDDVKPDMFCLQISIMASRAGPRAAGTDGSDYQHRERVASHYQMRFIYLSLNEQ